MAKKIADLLIKIGADIYGITKMRGDVKKQLDELGKDLQGFGKSMSLYVTAPLAAAAGTSVHLADVQIRAEAKVQQAIKSTSGAAKLNFEQLKKYASELQGKTVFGDEQILNESTAQLLTFTNIAGENFKRVQQAALDVATVLDGDLKSTTIQLGKALNDPVKNLSALSRSGIQFSKDQIGLIKSLAETNRLEEAQTIILDELNRQYGGQAEAAAKVGLGFLRQLKNYLGDLGEELGMVLMPIVQQVVGWVQNLGTWLQNLSPATKTAIVVIGGIAAAIGPLALGLGAVLKLLPLLSAGFAAMCGPVGWVTAAIGALAFGLIKLLTSTTDAEKANKKLQQNFSRTESAVAAERYQIDLLFARLKAAKEGTQEYGDAKQRILDKYGAYLSKLGDEKSALDDIATAYRTIVEEATRAIRVRALDTIIQESAETYANKQSEVYNAVEEMLKRKFKGQKTSEGIDLSAYYLMKLQPVIMDEASVTAEIRDIINEFDVESFIWGDSADGFGQAVKKTNRLLDLLNSVRTAKKIADDSVADASAKWSVSSDEIEEQKGLLEQLQDRLRGFEKAREKATSQEDIVAINQQIAQTRQEIEKINGVGLLRETPETLGLLEKLQQQISELEKAKKAATSTYEIHNLNAAIRSLREELEELQNTGSKKGVANDTGNSFSVGIEPLRFDPDAINPPESDWTEAKQRFANNLSRFVSEAQGMALDVAPMLRTLLADLGTAIGEGIGNILSGDGTFDDLLASIGQLMGSFLKTLGKQLIMIGTMSLSIRDAFINLWDKPWLAIGMGIAAVAMGTAMMNSFRQTARGGIALAEGGLAYGPTMALVGDNRRAGSDPEVIAPLSKLRQYGLGRQTIEFIGGTFSLSGTDLLLSVRREDARINYVNANFNG